MIVLPGTPMVALPDTPMIVLPGPPVIALPDTPPCSPSSPDWFKTRFTPDTFTTRDLRRWFAAGDITDSPETEVDENEQQVRAS